MKVLHVIPSIAKTSGGPARSCQGLVAAECAAGVDAWIWSLDGGEPWVAGVRQVKNPVRVADFDIVHVHGIWSPALHRVCGECRRQGVPYVVAPRGMLEPWSLKQKRMKKLIARWLYQDRDLRQAVALHATAESEAEQFRALGFKNRVIVSPNGVNVPEGNLAKAEGEGRKGSEERRALYVSRMHPKKGVLELVESWAKVKPRGWKCELVYTLNGEVEREYEAKVKEKVAQFGLGDQFVFTGPLNDDKKWEAYARAELFVLPTYSENFGIVVAEALYAGVPVITTKGTPWEELERVGCGRWIELPPKESLERALGEMSGKPREELAAMGSRGRKLVEDKYLWSAVVKPMIEGYEACFGIGH